MTRSTSTVKVGLLGMYGSANLGDTAIQQVMLAELGRRRPDVSFVGLSSSPEDVARTFGIPGYPATGLGRLVLPGQIPDGAPAPRGGRLTALRNIFRAAGGLDMIVVSGGGQLEDFWGGPWAQPFRLLSWAASTRVRGRALAAFGVGVDELRSPLSERFARTAVRLAQVRYFRDADSRERICGPNGTSPAAGVAPDPAFGLRDLPGPPGDGSHDAAPVAVLSPVSDAAFGTVGDDAYDRYLTSLAAAGDALVRDGLRVRFVCSQTTMDPPVAEEVTGRMSESDGVELPEVTDVDGFLEAVSGARVVVASRLHAIILSAVAGRPVVAVSPSRKADRQMADLELEGWCLDMRTAEPDQLVDLARRAADHHEPLATQVQARVRSLREGLDRAFDDLAAAIPERGKAGRSIFP